VLDSRYLYKSVYIIPHKISFFFLTKINIVFKISIFWGEFYKKSRFSEKCKAGLLEYIIPSTASKYVWFSASSSAFCEI
ncbi:MAG: hypothetical protein ACTSO2_18960, partial [Promethearchaeota archaeon]